jgi:hypothetical protein
MHNNKSTTPAVAAAQPVNHQTQTRTLKLALDVHLLQHVVAMQYDGEFPKPPQRFTPKEFLKWVEKQIGQGWRIVSCYEAGPFGYVLHRQLSALGVTNYVIRPRNWDDQHQRVKTDTAHPYYCRNSFHAAGETFRSSPLHDAGVVILHCFLDTAACSSTRAYRHHFYAVRVFLARLRCLRLADFRRESARTSTPAAITTHTTKS